MKHENGIRVSANATHTEDDARPFALEKLRVLILEDDLNDCEFNLREIRKAGYDPEWKRVDSKRDFISALETFSPEIILSDYSMPQFNASAALDILREKDKVTPFIMISGTVGEEIAVDMMRKGANDYFLKDRLSRLGQSIRKAMEQKKILLDKMRADEEILRMEKRLLQSQKMESLGTLAGGIAHDFNNILTPILGYSEVCLLSVKKDTNLHSHLEEIRLAAKRAKELVGQILAFCRREEYVKKPIKVLPVVKEVLKLIRASIPLSIDIVQDLDQDCGFILADPTQIHQVMMNLCTNAFHAMERTGGQLNITVKNSESHSLFLSQQFIILTIFF